MQKRAVSVLVTVLILINIYTPGAFAQPQPQIKSEAAILTDSKTGRVIYEKNADKRLYPASTTKIMSAILVLDKLNLSDVVVASREAVMSIPLGGSNMGIMEGEQLTVEQLLYGMLVASANEACNVIAEYMCGSVDEFVVQMNQKAQELGMSNTKFLNPHGLHSPEHYTTARDMVVLARYAMKNEKFRQVVSTAQYMIEPTNKYTKQRNLVNTNYLVSSTQNASYYYPKATGIKTGYTSQAGNCLVSSASNVGVELIAVTLNAAPQTGAIYSFVDSKALFEYGFRSYENKILVKENETVTEAKVAEGLDNDFVILTAKNDFEALLPVEAGADAIAKTVTLADKIAAPITKGQTLGRISYSYDGYALGEVELVANMDIKRDLFMFIMNRIFGFFNAPAVKIPMIILILIFAALYILRRIKRRRRRRYLRSKRY